MKVAYISYLPLADVDFSYLHEAQQIMDITCYMFVNPHHIKRSVIHFGQLLDKTGIFDTNQFPELNVYEGFVNLSKIKVINVAEEKNWQFTAYRLLNLLSKEMSKEYDIIQMTRIPQWMEFPFYRFRKKIVLSIHDPLPHSGISWKKRLITDGARRLALKMVNNIIIYNNKQKEEFVKHYHLNNKNVIVSRLGCYTCLRPIANSNPICGKSKYILFAGRITPYKGLQYLLPAIKNVHKKYPEIKLIVAGSGDFCFNEKEYLDLDYIEFRHRFIPDEELVELIRNSLFLVCPYTDATQSGVIMSSFAFNVPVLSTNVGGIPEMIEDGRFGRIVKEKSVEAIEEGICVMLADDQVLKQFSQNIENEYNQGVRSWKNISEQLKKEYERIVKSN